ncbi:MAG: leucine-rich repeat domain-containing protein [Bacteriovoracaceae bacterium]|nr:leucine-rich repeat domain-containing protein [Bacteriovoracaceae bacterium]
MRQKILLATSLLFLFLSCSKKENSTTVEDPTKDIAEIEKIEKDELNKSGIELAYKRNQTEHSVGLSDSSKSKYMDWASSEDAMKAINHYIEVTDKFIKKFSNLESTNNKVAEIMLKNKYLKQKLKTALLISPSKEHKGNELKWRDCPTNFISQTKSIEALFNQIFPYGAKTEQALKTSKEFSTHFAPKELSIECEKFISSFGDQKFECKYKSNDGTMNYDSSYQGWRFCEQLKMANTSYPKYFEEDQRVKFSVNIGEIQTFKIINEAAMVIKKSVNENKFAYISDVLTWMKQNFQLGIISSTEPKENILKEMAGKFNQTTKIDDFKILLNLAYLKKYSKLFYQKDKTNIFDIDSVQMSQCYSGTWAFWYSLLSTYPEVINERKLVNIYAEGHILPGEIQNIKGVNYLFGFESTVIGKGLVRFGDVSRLDKKIIVIDLKTDLIIDNLKFSIKNNTELRNQAIQNTMMEYGISYIATLQFDPLSIPTGLVTFLFNQSFFAFGDSNVDDKVIPMQQMDEVPLDSFGHLYGKTNTSLIIPYAPKNEIEEKRKESEEIHPNLTAEKEIVKVVEKNDEFINICDRDIFGVYIAKSVGAENCEKVSRRKMVSLEKIDLSGARISTIPQNAFEGLFSLKEIDLSNNQISTLPDDLFKDMKDLKLVDLQDNPIEKVERDCLGINEEAWITLGYSLKPERKIETW